MDTFATSMFQFVWQVWTMQWVLVCKHVIPITFFQLAKHEMTVKAVWGVVCLQIRGRRQLWSEELLHGKYSLEISGEIKQSWNPFFIFETFSFRWWLIGVLVCI